MNPGEDKPTPVWLRLCEAVVGAILRALGAAALLFLLIIFRACPTDLNMLAFIVALGSAGGFVGFLLPRQTLSPAFLPGLSE